VIVEPSIEPGPFIGDVRRINPIHVRCRPDHGADHATGDVNGQLTKAQLQGFELAGQQACCRWTARDPALARKVS
jgi:hypothetical protein